MSMGQIYGIFQKKSKDNNCNNSGNFYSLDRRSDDVADIDKIVKL